MKTTRRQALATGAAMLATGWRSLASAQGAADSYPSGPVKIVVGFSAGGPTDLAARLVAAKLQQSMGQSFIVDDKPGAGSNLASGIVAEAAPDGATLLMAAAPLAINNHLYKNLKWNVLTSFAPITQVMSAPCILAVRPGSYKSVAEIVADAKKRPGALSFSSSGAGGSQHLAGELFQQKAGIKLIHVPYKGASPALNDLLGGQIQMGFMTSLSSVPYFTSGKLRALAVCAEHRLPQLPDVPTMAEAGYPGVEMNSWSGLLAPANTPPEIIAKLNRETVKALQAPDVHDKLVSQGAMVVASTPQEFKDYLAREYDNYGKLIKAIHLSLD